MLSPSVRELALHRLVWRLRPEGSGKHVLRLTGCGQNVEFPLYVGGFVGSIAPARQAGVLAHLPRSARVASKRRFWLGPYLRRVSPRRNRMAGLADGMFPALRLCRQKASEQVSGRSQRSHRRGRGFNQLSWGTYGRSM